MNLYVGSGVASQMTETMRLEVFPQTAQDLALKGLNFVYDFSYKCLLLRFTQIDLWNVQLPELCVHLQS